MGSVGEEVQLQFQEPTIVKISDDERLSGRMTDENIAVAVIAFHRDGFVVLENIVDHEHCDKINELMVEEADQMMDDPKTIWNDNVKAPKEERSGNIQHPPPLKTELMFEDIWANKFTGTVLAAVLGPNPVCNFADGNTALGKGYGGRQGIHADMAYNFPQIPCGVTANYYLEDASKANGSTELWLGSARDTTFRDHKACRDLKPGEDPFTPKLINLVNPDGDFEMELNFGVRPERYEARRKFAPPVQPSVKKGSVMLRDLRLWHAGIANPSNRTRVMLNFIHTPFWYKCPTRISLPEATKPLIEGWASRKDFPIVFNARYLATEADCKAQKYGIDFSSRNVGYWKSVPKGLAPGFTFVEG